MYGVCIEWKEVLDGKFEEGMIGGIEEMGVEREWKILMIENVR